MKRVALLAGGTVLALTLVACGGGHKKAEQPQQQEMTQTVQPAVAPQDSNKPAEPAAEPAAPAAEPAPAAGIEQPAH